MNRGQMLVSFSALALALSASATASAAGAGAVYAMTNAAAGNSVIVYDRADNGTLTYAAEYLTGGLGTGGAVKAVNPLGTQGSLVLSDDQKWLFAANAASDDVSVFRVKADGLKLVDVVASGGDFPASLTSSNGALYVLNEGNGGNVTGFSIGFHGELSPIPGSTRALGAPVDATSPFGQIQFNPDGDALFVTDKMMNQIDVFPLDGQRMLSASPTVTPSLGLVPFAFTFDQRDHFILADVAGVGAGTSTVSSFDIEEGGYLLPVSVTVPDFQAASCWIAGSFGSNYVYTANTGSSTITGFFVNPDGSLTMLNADGVTAAFPNSGARPIDSAMVRSGKFLYTLNAGTGTVGSFAVGTRGALTSLGEVGGLAALAGIQGLAAR